MYATMATFGGLGEENGERAGANQHLSLEHIVITEGYPTMPRKFSTAKQDSSMDSVGRNIYLAGKFLPLHRDQQDWRLSIVAGLEPWMDSEAVRTWQPMPRAIFGRFTYIGPFFTDLDDESQCGHGSYLALPHGVHPAQTPVAWKHDGDTPYARQSVISLCLQAIAKADLVFAWIDRPDCYGTLFELGYAKALGKRIAVCFPQGTFYQYHTERQSQFFYDDHGLRQSEWSTDSEELDPLDELWFTALACGYQICEEGPLEALKQVIATLGWEVFPETFDSPLEAMFAEEWRAQSLHLLYPLVSQQPIKNGAYRIDFAFPRYQVGIELDGYTYHSDRDAFTRDRQRQREIEALGWHIIRFSGDELRQDLTACVREAARFLDIQKQRQEL